MLAFIRLVSGAFTARRVQALRPTIEAMVADLLDEMSGEVDFISSFAFPLPVNVIGELLGVPPEDRAQFQPLVRDVTQVLEVITPEVLATADPAAAAIRAHLLELVERRRRDPGPDLLRALVAVDEAGDQLTEDELLTTAALLFAAGFGTTTNLLANGLVALLELGSSLDGAGSLRPLYESPELAVEELLRYDSPVQLVPRVTTDPVELGGVAIGAGERVVAYLGAPLARLEARRVAGAAASLPPTRARRRRRTTKPPYPQRVSEPSDADELSVADRPKRRI